MWFTESINVNAVTFVYRLTNVHLQTARISIDYLCICLWIVENVNVYSSEWQNLTTLYFICAVSSYVEYYSRKKALFLLNTPIQMCFRILKQAPGDFSLDMECLFLECIVIPCVGARFCLGGPQLYEPFRFFLALPVAWSVAPTVSLGPPVLNQPMERYHWVRHRWQRLVGVDVGRGWYSPAASLSTKSPLDAQDPASHRLTVKSRTVVAHCGPNQSEHHSICKGYQGNGISTTKYSLLSFIPKNLFEQFHRWVVFIHAHIHTHTQTNKHTHIKTPHAQIYIKKRIRCGKLR